MNPRRMTEDGPVLSFIVGEPFAATGLVLCRKPAKSTAQIVAGVLTFDSPGLYRFARRGENSYVEAVAFDPRAMGLLYSHTTNAGEQVRDGRGALRSLILDGRCTAALLAETIEADPRVLRPGPGEAGGFLPFQH